jgi:hypothetical protein
MTSLARPSERWAPVGDGRMNRLQGGVGVFANQHEPRRSAFLTPTKEF